MAGIASLFVGPLMYRLVRHDETPDVALRSAWFLLIFPTAYFLHIGYTEALFMALVLGSFLAARTERWWLAGLIGGLAALTRINGLVLLLALPVEAATQWFSDPRSRPALAMGVAGDRAGRDRLRRLPRPQPGDLRDAVPVPDRAARALVQVAGARPGTPSTPRSAGSAATKPDNVLMYGGMELLFVVIGLVGTIYAAFRFRPSWFAWMAGNLVLFVSTSFLLSTPRYVLTLFPLFVALALATGAPGPLVAVSAISLAGFVYFAGRFATGGLGLLTMGRIACPRGACAGDGGSCSAGVERRPAPRWTCPTARPLGAGATGPTAWCWSMTQGLDAASWATQAATFADKGMTVVAVESATPGAAVSALRSLLEDGGLDRVALLGAGDGAGVALQAALDEPELVDQLVVISASGDAAALDVFPKLFVASEGEPAAGDAERMADESRGDWNALFLAPGEASGQALLSDETGGEPAMEAIVARLEERR